MRLRVRSLWTAARTLGRGDLPLALTEREVRAMAHPHTGLVDPFTVRPPVEVLDVSPPQSPQLPAP